MGHFLPKKCANTTIKIKRKIPDLGIATMMINDTLLIYRIGG